MKNVFGIDVTQDRKNTQIDGLVFLQRSAPQAEQDALDRYSARLNEIQKRRLLPAPLRVFQWLLGLILLCVVYGVIEGLAEISATAERPSLLLPFCLLAVPALLWLLLFLAARRRKKRVDCQGGNATNLPPVGDASAQRLRCVGRSPGRPGAGCAEIPLPPRKKTAKAQRPAPV